MRDDETRSSRRALAIAVAAAALLSVAAVALLSSGSSAPGARLEMNAGTARWWGE